MTPILNSITVWVNSITIWINVYALIVTLLGALLSTKKILRFRRTRHLRKIWGIKDGAFVTVVCSELEDPTGRQHVEPREFIYSLKYGDVDAYFEVITTLFKLYPTIKLSIKSAGEAMSAQMNPARNLILIGGPDYNAYTERVLSWDVTQFDYRSPDVSTQSEEYPEEIVLYDKQRKREYCHLTDERDYGYFERIANPNNPKMNIVLIGGCHTIGVTGAVKAFSMADSENGEIPNQVLDNAAMVAKRVGKAKNFTVLVSAERIGQTISTPVVRIDDISVHPATFGGKPLKSNNHDDK